MARDIRKSDSSDTVTERREIRAEALRQMESCLYTSTMLYSWLRAVRRQHMAVVLIPIILTAAAGFSYVQDCVPGWLVALLGFVASLIPALAYAMKIETHVDELKRTAANYKGLQDRFRQLATIGAGGDLNTAKQRLDDLMDRMDSVRSNSLTPPEKYFVEAGEKIKRGDYDFSVDETLRALEGIERPTALPPFS